MIFKSEMVPTTGLVEENAELRTRLMAHEAGVVRDEAIERVAMALFMSDENIPDPNVAFDLWDAMSKLQQRIYLVRGRKIHAYIIALRDAPLLLDDNGDVQGFPGHRE